MSVQLAPYDVDIEAAGIFSAIPAMPLADRDEFVVVNGCSVIYSAIRDQLLTLTSRSARGSLSIADCNLFGLPRQSKSSDKKSVNFYL